MRPERTCIQPTPDADLRGLVIAFRDERIGKLVAHRCVGQGKAGNGKTWYATKGDGNEVRDPIRREYSEIVGVLDLPRK